MDHFNLYYVVVEFIIIFELCFRSHTFIDMWFQSSCLWMKMSWLPEVMLVKMMMVVRVIISLHVHDEILKIVSVFSVMILSWSQ